MSDTEYPEFGPAPEIDDFGREIVRLVRDLAVSSAYVCLRPAANFSTAHRWRRAAQEESLEDYSKMIIADVVDTTIFHLLDAIDNGFRLILTTPDGKTVDLCKDGLGEMAGWYVGKGGWVERFSKEPYFLD